MKKLALLALSGILAVGCAANGIIAAQAAVKTNEIGTQVLTDKGNLNVLDWDTSGDSTHFEPTITNYYMGSPAGDTTYVYYAQPLKLSEGDVVVEYNMLSGAPSNWLGPWINTTADKSVNIADFQNYVGSYSVSVDTGWTNYTDEALTTVYPHASIDTTYKYTDDVKTIVRYTFKAENRVFGIESFGEKADGTQVTINSMWFKDKLKTEIVEGSVYFGAFFGGGYQADNFVVKQKVTEGDKTDWKVLASTDFTNANDIVSQADAANAAVDTTGKFCAEGPRNGESYLRLKDYAPTDRMVSGLSVDGDHCEIAFTMEGQIRINSLVEKFGLATGLEKADSAVDSAIYLYNEGETTKVGSTKTGEVVDLGVNLVGKAEMTPFKVVGKTDGEVAITFSALNKTATFTGFTVKGKLAFVVTGEGNNSIDLEKHLVLTTNSFQASEKEGDANNFNTGYLNEKNWKIQSTTSNLLEDSREAKGVYLEDGVVNFWGSADGSYISTTHMYADYILEFDHISIANKPATTWTYGHGGLAIGLGANSYSGWVNSAMIIIQSEYFQLQDFKANSAASSQTAAGETFADGTFVHATGETDKVTSIKVVVMNGNIKIYFQDITTAEFDSANYVLAADFTVPDAHGYISLCANESSFFKLDNIRVTSISDADTTVMEERIAAYVDRQPIADEAAPVVLTAPTLTLEENVVSWQAVDNATGYKVIVNGVEGDVITDTSYTIEVDAGETAEVTVVAVGNGETYLDSVASAAVTYTAPGEAVSTPESTPEVTSNSTSAGGCMGSVSSIGLLSVGMLLAVKALTKKRED